MEIPIENGRFYDGFMTVFMTLFEIKEKPFMEQITSYNFYRRAVGFFGVGIFILGYQNWKQAQKNKS